MSKNKFIVDTCSRISVFSDASSRRVMAVLRSCKKRNVVTLYYCCSTVRYTTHRDVESLLCLFGHICVIPITQLCAKEPFKGLRLLLLFTSSAHGYSSHSPSPSSRRGCSLMLYLSYAIKISYFTDCLLPDYEKLTRSFD